MEESQSISIACRIPEGIAGPYDECSDADSFADPRRRIQKKTNTASKLNASSSLSSTTRNHTTTSRSTISNSSTSGYGMDHVYLSFLQLLWAYTFVGLASYFKAIRGIYILRLRKALLRMGLIDAKPFDRKTCWKTCSRTDTGNKLCIDIIAW